MSLALLLMVLCGPVGEAAQGRARFLLFVGITVILSAIVTSVVHILLYVVSRDDVVFFGTAHGAAGVATVLALAAHQADPDHVVVPAPAALPSAALRARRLPFVCLCVFGGLSLVGVSDGGILMLSSLLSGWVYLRFLQPPGEALLVAESGSGPTGDGRDHMAFVALFPQPLRGILSPLLSLAVLPCRPCAMASLGQGNSLPVPGASAANGQYAAMQPLGMDDGLSDSGGLDPVAERRRAKARQALDARLAELERRRMQRGPSLQLARKLAAGDLPTAADDEAPAATAAE
jgi:hypothetical protein